jgi:hypothetical protein
MKKVFCFVCLSMALASTGCAINAKYVVDEGVQTATVAIVAQADTQDVTALYYNAFLLPDNQCPAVRKNMLGARLIAKPREEFPAVRIPAGAPLMVGLTYQDARFAQNRECGYQARFTPMPGEAYRLDFSTTQDGQACRVAITDAAGNPVPYEPSDEVCLPSLHPDAVYVNGVGHDVIYDVRIQSY